jgi:hypothetical protein
MFSNLIWTNNLSNQFDGTSATDRDGFSKLDLTQYYGAMPVSLFNDLADKYIEQ